MPGEKAVELRVWKVSWLPRRPTFPVFYQWSDWTRAEYQQRVTVAGPLPILRKFPDAIPGTVPIYIEPRLSVRT